MEIQALTPEQVSAAALRVLRVGSPRGLFEVPALAAALRRAASFLCPAPPGRIVRSVGETLETLEGYGEGTLDHIEATLEALVGDGDLVELPPDSERRHRVLVLGPPAFIRRRSGVCVLLGVRPDGAPLLDDELMGRVEYAAQLRILRPAASPCLADDLKTQGLWALAPAHWVRAPQPATAAEVVEQHQRLLSASAASGDVRGLRLLDPSSPVTYYRGRWRSSNASDTGNFVARRPQAYGPDIWCFAEIRRGHLVRFVDLDSGLLGPAADTAWRLQAALDASAGKPQVVRARLQTTSTTLLDLFSPLPSWAQRHLQVVATPQARSGGALLSYAVPQDEVAEELGFLESMLWIAVTRG
jgi:hypothetical protein